MGFVVAAVAIAFVVWWCRGDRSEHTTEDALAQRSSRHAVNALVVKPTTLAGRVISKRDGKPIASATVAVAPYRSTDATNRSLAPMLARTDARGAWSLQAPVGKLSVAVAARGFEPESVTITLSPDGDPDVEIVMDPGGTSVRGVVTDAGGGPVAGVQIAARRQTGATLYSTFATLTDERGHYELTLRRGFYALSATHEDYVTARDGLDVPASGNLVRDVTLEIGGVIRGHVVTTSGEGVPGASVATSNEEAVVADETGSFELRGVPPGIARIEAWAPRSRSIDWTYVPIGGGEQLDDIAIVVSPAFVIRGRTVVKGRPTEPIAEASLTAHPVDLFARRSTARSQADGSFELHGVLPGAYRLGVWSDAVSVASDFDVGGVRVDVIDRDVANVVVELELGTRVTGKVVPAMVASILPRCGYTRSESDASGRFVAEHLPIGACQFTASTEDGWVGETEAIAGGKDIVTIQLRKRRHISGRVVWSDGTPAGKIRVVETRSRASGVYTDATGAFSMFVPEAPSFELLAHVSGDASNPVRLAVPENSEDVVLTLPARTLTLRGSVVDPSGVPQGGARVSLLSEAGGDVPDVLESASTQADGGFVFEHLRAGRYDLIATAANGTAQGDVKAIEAGARARVVLTPLGVIRGRVTLDGSPVTAFEIDCAEKRRTVQDRDGAFRFPNVVPGKHRCEVRAKEGTAEGEVDVTAGVATIDLALQRPGTVTGTLVDILTGEPISNLYVLPNTFRATDQVRLGRVQPTDAGGRFRITAPAGRQWFMRTKLDLSRTDALWNAVTTVRPGETSDLGVIETSPLHQPGTLGIRIEGAKVTVVEQPAVAAGIQVGDELVAINGQPLAKLRDYFWEVIGAGKTYRVTLSRGITVSVTAIKAN